MVSAAEMLGIGYAVASLWAGRPTKAQVHRLPLNREAQNLDSGPQSAQEARRWVASVCQEIGRDELTECAELGISELVTNALLHAGPPIAVRLRGTRDHPRVEVFDPSHQPPNPNTRLTDEESLLSTIGRGLGIVARSSIAWGAEIHPRGKWVWFEPATEIRDDGDLEGDVYDYSRGSPSRLGEAELVDGIDILMRAMPLAAYSDFQQHYHELRRELRILSLAHGNDYPVARNLTELFMEYDDELRLSRGFDQIEAALDTGLAQLDVKVTVPQETPETMAKMIELLEMADTFCRDERLLSLATTPQQLKFQRWFLGEFVRQGDGKSPKPWPGDEAAPPRPPATT